MSQQITRQWLKRQLEGIGLRVVKVGKVRVLANLSRDCFLMVASDEVSAYDWNQRPPIPDKGKILTALSTQ
jgi:phosphoribosylaminoimidazole-succinocarboxamide synthase